MLCHPRDIIAHWVRHENTFVSVSHSGLKSERDKNSGQTAKTDSVSLNFWTLCFFNFPRRCDANEITLWEQYLRVAAAVSAVHCRCISIIWSEALDARRRSSSPSVFYDYWERKNYCNGVTWPTLKPHEHYIWWRKAQSCSVGTCKMTHKQVILMWLE